MFLGSVALRRVARKLGAHLVDEKPDVVLVARDRRFNYARLKAAARAIQDGAILYAACPDWRHPGRDGYPVPEAGVLAEAIARVSGVKIDRVVGKPEPYLFELACERAGLRLSDCTVIGDNPLTDGRGAATLGLPFVRVEPGHLPDLLSANLAPHAC
jgi:ribonucleotide monophosphatase NagD (HAD superfamily)